MIIMKKGTTNLQLKKTIEMVRKQKKDLWRTIAKELNRSSRIRRSVNLSRINRVCKDGEIALVPGKVLGSGDLNKKIKIAAFNFSTLAKDKIKSAGGSAITILDLLKDNPEAKGVRIVG